MMSQKLPMKLGKGDWMLLKPQLELEYWSQIMCLLPLMWHCRLHLCLGLKGLQLIGGIGTAADVTSLGLKGVDLLIFDGTQEAFQAQAIKTGFSFTKAEGLKKIRQVQK